MNIRRFVSLALACACLAWGSQTGRADTPITNFTPGDLVVLRGGDATNPDTTASTSQVSLYLDEYTPSGSYAGTISIPSSGANALTLPSIGDFQHNGVLNISGDGRSLTFAGYQVPAGSADAFAQTGTSQYQPVVGIVGNQASSLNTTTPVNSYWQGSASPYIRGAYTNDGNEFWTFGKYPASGATSNGGLAYVAGTGPTATTTTVEGFADWRDIRAVNGQLYGGTGSSSVGNHGAYQISTGEPTTNLGNSQSNNTQLGSNNESASGIALLDLPGDPNAQNGLNVLYTIGDSTVAGINKYYYNGSTWVPQGQVTLNLANNVANPTGLIATVDPTNPNWVDINVSGTNGIYTYVDQTGYNGAIPANSFTQLVAPPANEAFYGVALAPAAVPEPSTIVLAAVGCVCCGLAARRRRRASSACRSPAWLNPASIQPTEAQVKVNLRLRLFSIEVNPKRC